MGNSEVKPAFTRQQARDFVRAVLCTVDERQGVIDGSVKLAPLPWINEAVTYQKYRKALLDSEDQAIKAGMRSEELKNGHRLVDEIHRVWRGLYRSESEPVEPAMIRQILVEEGVIKLKPPAVPATPQSSKEVRTNPFPLKGGHGIRWV